MSIKGNWHQHGSEVVICWCQRFFLAASRIAFTALPLNSVAPNEKTPLEPTVIGHVWYINILTWLWVFQVKPLYFVLFSLYLSLFWELRDKGNLKNLQFWPKSLGAMLEYWYIERGLLVDHQSINQSISRSVSQSVINRIQCICVLQKFLQQSKWKENLRRRYLRYTHFVFWTSWSTTSLMKSTTYKYQQDIAE